MRERLIAGVVVLAAVLLVAGLYVSDALDQHRPSLGASRAVAAPSTKEGAEYLVLWNAVRLMSPEIRPKFVDAATGMLQTNDYAQCYPSTTTTGWWVCELDSLVHPRPQVWFSVSFTGEIREKGEQPLGYGWVPATSTVSAPRRARPDSGLVPPSLPVTR